MEIKASGNPLELKIDVTRLTCKLGRLRGIWSKFLMHLAHSGYNILHQSAVHFT
jgi:hypothetical protein